VYAQGNCTESPSEVLKRRASEGPWHLQPGQCMLLVDRPLLQTRDSFLWVENFYIRVVDTRNGKLPLPMVYAYDSEVVMSNLTVQGERGISCLGDSCVLQSDSSSALVEGVIMHYFSSMILERASGSKLVEIAAAPEIDKVV
jgi:hypothetical protein